MIDGPAALHWATFYDPRDGEPYGETYRCSIGVDHDGNGTPNGLEDDE